MCEKILCPFTPVLSVLSVLLTSKPLYLLGFQAVTNGQPPCPFAVLLLSFQ